MKSILPSIEKYTEQLRLEGYSDKDIQYFWHNAVNAFKKRVESEKHRDPKNLTNKIFIQQKKFTVLSDDGQTITGRWSGNPKTTKVEKRKFLQNLENRVIWWEE